MTIVELPERKEGYVHLEVDGYLKAILWANLSRTNVSPMDDGRWIINIDNSFIYADAIRRK